jgi:hypothetical protein
MAKKKEAPARKTRRTVEQRIADLQKKIEEIKVREAEKRAQADPSKRHVKAALKALDKAIGASKDAALRRTLGEAREMLAGSLAGGDVGELRPRTRRTASEFEDLATMLLAYVRSNPGQRGEQIAEALGTDTGTMRPVMKRLIADGKVSTEGQRRGMTYSPA